MIALRIVLQVHPVSTSPVASPLGEIGKLLKVPLETPRLAPHLLAPHRLECHHLGALRCLVVVLEEERRMDVMAPLLQPQLLVTLWSPVGQLESSFHRTCAISRAERVGKMKRDGLKVDVDIEMHCNRYGVMALLLFLLLLPR
jgi:hypothetical protein